MPPNRFESEVESFLEGSHGDRTHIKRADHHTVTPLCGTLLEFCTGWAVEPGVLGEFCTGCGPGMPLLGQFCTGCPPHSVDRGRQAGITKPPGARPGGAGAGDGNRTRL